MPSEPSRPGEPDLAAALHEVGNALTVVVGWLEAAREGAEVTPGEALAFALSRARRAQRIARRAIGAHVPPEAEPLGDLVREAGNGVLPVAARASVEVTTRVEEGDAAVIVPCGEEALQIITNLLLNAISVSPEGGLVELEAAHDGEAVVVRVRDQGPGVPSADRAAIFARGVSARRGGAGIGLAHAASMAARAGGQLVLGPAAPGQGATFELTWPMGEPERPSRIIARERARTLAGVRVLVLDDDEAVVELLDTVLSARGAEVVSARESHALPAALAAAPFHVALLDASPLGDGSDDALTALVATSPDVRVVLISGSPDARVPAPLAHRGAARLQKPFEVSEVVEAVRSALAAPRRGP